MATSAANITELRDRVVGGAELEEIRALGFPMTFNTTLMALHLCNTKLASGCVAAGLEAPLDVMVKSSLLTDPPASMASWKWLEGAYGGRKNPAFVSAVQSAMENPSFMAQLRRVATHKVTMLNAWDRLAGAGR